MWKHINGCRAACRDSSDSSEPRLKCTCFACSIIMFCGWNILKSTSVVGLDKSYNKSVQFKKATNTTQAKLHIACHP